MRFKKVNLSLADLLGRRYAKAVMAANVAIRASDAASLEELFHEKVEFFSTARQRKLASLLPKVGTPVCEPLRGSPFGASTRMFDAATHAEMSPLAGWGYYRVGEDGRLRFLSKSEHYHTPLGHAFEGYRLVEYAHGLGIPNATHNNTRGYITRLLEAELVRTSNGLAKGDDAALGKALRSKRRGVLNRVLNLETGSLACEAGIKMMLARFYRVQDDWPNGAHVGRTPVFLVMGDSEGGPRANYHGTTIFAQVMRGMWPELGQAFERHGIMKVVSIRPNDEQQLESAFKTYQRGKYRIAGLLHELILMNYGGLRLTKRFGRRAHALCREHDVPTMVDEIQSCLWSPQLYLFREYGIRPNFVVIGKGFPGGEYPASRIIFDSTMDCLPQFGALVTNGQEELASLAYLVTMRWAEENAAITSAIGAEYEARLRSLVRRYPQHAAAVAGKRHLASVYFHDLDKARAFVDCLVAGGLDISVQSYKASCPPGALTKLPLIADLSAVDMVIERMTNALADL